MKNDRIKKSIINYLQESYENITIKSNFELHNNKYDLFGINNNHVISVLIKKKEDKLNNLFETLLNYKRNASGVYIAIHKTMYVECVKVIKSSYKLSSIGILIYDNHENSLFLQKSIKWYSQYPNEIKGLLYDNNKINR